MQQIDQVDHQAQHHRAGPLAESVAHLSLKQGVCASHTTLKDPC